MDFMDICMGLMCLMGFIILIVAIKYVIDHSRLVRYAEGGKLEEQEEEEPQKYYCDTRFVPVPSAEDFQRLESKIDNLQKTIDEISNKNTHIV